MEQKTLSKAEIKAMPYDTLLCVVISGCKFMYFSYDHKKAMVDYRELEKWKPDFRMNPMPDSHSMPNELKEKYKVERIGKLREIHFAPNGKAWRFKIGNKYAKSFSIDSFGISVFPIVNNA